jgi:hypothetical protein
LRNLDKKVKYRQKALQIKLFRFFDKDKVFNGQPASERPMFGHVPKNSLEEGTNIKNDQIPQKLK